MPRLDPHKVPEVKLDSGAAFIEAALTREQRRGLFERPDMSVFAIVQLTSKSYTGFADGEEKDPTVKVRVTLAEVAQDDRQAQLVAEVMRAMMRRRRMDQTLDELGPGAHDVEATIAEALAHHPTEAEYDAQNERRRGNRIEHHG
ncbi:hypothetical protein [Streptomyces decoyicus]